MIVRYITQHDLEAYRHWRVTYYGERGDGLACFIASWKCCCGSLAVNPPKTAEITALYR